MKVAVVGSGGREHAILTMLAKSRHRPTLYAIPGNGGMSDIARCVDLSVMDFKSIVAFCEHESIDFVVVAPDDPLVGGLVDELEAAGFPCFGPNRRAAAIEGSKSFSKQFMEEEGIPTADYCVFSSYDDAKKHVQTMPDEQFPTVLKADGLALGKGVAICLTREDALDALHRMMVQKQFGESGNTVIIEEFLEGPEVTVLCFADGEKAVPMLSSMDHKAVGEGNKGPNTGGIGVVAPNPYYTDDIADLVEKTIITPTMEGMKKRGCPFKGCLYIGLMLTKKGPKVIEYNCRFGDPEAECILPLLESDLLDIMMEIQTGCLMEKPRFRNECSATVMVCSGGYPLQYEIGKEVTFDEKFKTLLQSSPTYLFHSATRKEGEILLTNGGRVFACSA